MKLLARPSSASPIGHRYGRRVFYFRLSLFPAGHQCPETRRLSVSKRTVFKFYDDRLTILIWRQSSREGVIVFTVYLVESLNTHTGLKVALLTIQNLRPIVHGSALASGHARGSL